MTTLPSSVVEVLERLRNHIPIQLHLFEPETVPLPPCERERTSCEAKLVQLSSATFLQCTGCGRVGVFGGDRHGL